MYTGGQKEMKRIEILRQSRYWIKKLGFKNISIYIKREDDWVYGQAQLKKGGHSITFFGMKEEDLLPVLFHELGHIYYNHCRIKNTSSFQEYKAEKFALRNLKKFLPDKFEYRINQLERCINNFAWAQIYPEHTEALMKILKGLK